MSQVQGTGWCVHCGQQRLTHRQSTNHVLHLILTLVTLGLWGIVWAIVAFNNRSKPGRCSVCGSAVSAHQPQSVSQA